VAPVPLMTDEITANEDERGVVGGGEELQLISANIVAKPNGDTQRLGCMCVDTAASAARTCRVGLYLDCHGRRHHGVYETDRTAQPAITVTQSSAPRTAVELPPPRAGAKILLIDDDFAILDGVSDFLESEGFSVVPASNGLEALNRLRSGLRVDAIVLDVMMPMMDGWDFRAEQLADPSLRDTPVVVISACGFTRRTLLHQFKAYDVLSKPLELKGFLRSLRRACRSSNRG
jgi:CheY-like chemotaxis protein